MTVEAVPRAFDVIRGLYFVTADVPELGRTHEGLAVHAAAGGACIVQFRHKRFDARRLQAARAVRDVCSAFGALFIVNDDAALAVAACADGLHLGQSDLSALDEWRACGRGLLGVSVSTAKEAMVAVALGADYLGVGPIFATGSKDDAVPPIGLDGLRRVREAVGLPLAAIGGIAERNAADVLAAGGDAVCVISAVAHARDPHAAARRLADIAASVPFSGGAQ
ncbi:MAG: thiamine phosphate synthase [Actinomycetota bacterium]|nr:thiamine phosphate synthase [Actinomycetota bacterium]